MQLTEVGQFRSVDALIRSLAANAHESSSKLHLSLKKIKMNPRRVHELMQIHFPPVDAASRPWKNIVEQDKLQENELLSLLDNFIHADQVLVEVHRKLGDYLSRKDACAFVAAHVGKGEIRIADREFRGFIVISCNGVACGWSDATPNADARCGTDV